MKLNIVFPAGFLEIFEVRYLQERNLQLLRGVFYVKSVTVGGFESRNHFIVFHFTMEINRGEGSYVVRGSLSVCCRYGLRIVLGGVCGSRVPD